MRVTDDINERTWRYYARHGRWPDEIIVHPDVYLRLRAENQASAAFRYDPEENDRETFCGFLVTIRLDAPKEGCEFPDKVAA